MLIDTTLRERRDRFVAAALTGILAAAVDEHGHRLPQAAAVAEAAREYADAAIAELDKTSPAPAAKQERQPPAETQPASAQDGRAFWAGDWSVPPPRRAYHLYPSNDADAVCGESVLGRLVIGGDPPLEQLCEDCLSADHPAAVELRTRVALVGMKANRVR